MKKVISLVLVMCILSTTTVHADFLGGLLGKWLGKKVEQGVERNKSIQRVNEAVEELKTFEQYVKTKETLEQKLPAMDKEDLQEFKRLVDDLTGEKGKEFESKAKQAASLKQRIKSKKKLNAKDHKKLQKWLEDKVDMSKHPLMDGNYNTNDLPITVMPIPTTMPMSAKIPLPIPAL